MAEPMIPLYTDEYIIHSASMTSMAQVGDWLCSYAPIVMHITGSY